MKTKLAVILILFNLHSLIAQFNDNDYTNMSEMSGSITDQDGFSLDLSYSFIQYMGIMGNLALRPEMVAYSNDAFQGIAKPGAATWCGYDFGGNVFHVLPYGGIAFNFLLGAGSESGFGITSNAIFGAKIFIRSFGIFGEYKYNLSKNFPENYDNRVSLGITFASGNSYIPQPPARKPTPQKPPKVKPIDNPTIIIEEYNRVELLYQATIDDLENAGYVLYITPSNRGGFISSGNKPNVAKVNSAKQYKLPIYYSREVSSEQIVAIAKNEPDLFLRTRIIHDYVSDIFYYDYDYLWNMEHLGTGNQKYSLATIIQIQRGVCLEYAILFTHLANAAGLDVYLIKNHSKPGIGHAYNTVNMYVIDTTWDSGNAYNQGKVVKSSKMNRKDYFMPGVRESYRLRGW